MTPPADARLRRLREWIETAVDTIHPNALAEAIRELLEVDAEENSAVSSYQTWQPDALQATIQILRATLADFATSRDMSLTLVRKKALRIYRETANVAGDAETPDTPASEPDK